MKLLRHIVKKPSTTVVKVVPTQCASCGSGRFFREPRTKQDLRFDIQRRYLCRSCSSATLVAGCPEELIEEAQISEQKSDNSEQATLEAVSTPIGFLEEVVNTSSAITLSVNDELQLKLKEAKEELAANQRLLDQKSKEMEKISAAAAEKEQTIQSLSRELQEQRKKAQCEAETLHSNNLNLQRQLSEAQEALRISKEATLKARKSAYKAAQQLKESRADCSIGLS